MAAGYHNIHCQSRVSVADGHIPLDASDLARFWAKVAKSEGCWLWQASVLGRSGHGQFTARPVRKQYHLYAHRVSWELHHGRLIPDGLCICHRCDVPLCVRPDHLFLGTQADNLADARNKGRLVPGWRKPKRVLEPVPFVVLPVRGVLTLQGLDPLVQAGHDSNQLGEQPSRAKGV